MIINENNIDESVRVMKLLKDGVLGEKKDDADFKYVITAREELSAVTEIFTTLEMNDRMSGNAPTDSQKKYASKLERDFPEKAKDVLDFLGKRDISELTKETISIFIGKLSGRP